MTDWIEHNGGPQPVASNIWVECIVALPELHGLTTYQAREASFLDWPNVSAYRILNQHLIDAARLGGIRLGLEAALAEAVIWVSFQMEKRVSSAIRALNPDTIAREADQ